MAQTEYRRRWFWRTMLAAFLVLAGACVIGSRSLGVTDFFLGLSMALDLLAAVLWVRWVRALEAQS